MDFNSLWQLLYDHGASAKKEEGTRRFWDTLTPQQQEQAFTTITTKLKEDKFVQYDPIRAIKENLPKGPLSQPTFLRGDEGGDLVQVKYNGLFKICTRQTAVDFHLPILRDWKR